MSKFAFAAVALVAASATTAHAADMPYRSRAPYTVAQPLNAYSWAGPYLGATLGYEWGSVSNTGAKPSGIAGGVTGGYNWQSGNIVFGLEGDLQGTGADDRFANYKFSNPWFGTARGRIGYAFNNVLLYGTAGVAWAALDTEGVGQSLTGWVAGVGVESFVTDTISVKAEYLYHDFGSVYVEGYDGDFDITANTFKVGVNFHF